MPHHGLPCPGRSPRPPNTPTTYLLGVSQGPSASPLSPPPAPVLTGGPCPCSHAPEVAKGQNMSSPFKQALNSHFSGQLPVLFRNSRSFFFKGKASDTQCDNQQLSEHGLLTQRTSCQDGTKLPPLPCHPPSCLSAVTSRTEAPVRQTQRTQQPRGLEGPCQHLPWPLLGPDSGWLSGSLTHSLT